MEKKHQLMKRLDEMKHVISDCPDTLAFIGLGSVGVELERLDDYSDLDFFLIVEDISKSTYIHDLSWLEKAHPLAYTFMNSKDGYKFFFADGIYGEFAVFGRSEVDEIVQAQGRLIWHKDDYDALNLVEAKGVFPKLFFEDVDFRVNEALTNLYVGLSRVLRGERLSGYRFIETYAFNQVIGIHHLVETGNIIDTDLFNLERRFEKRYPVLAHELTRMLSGYTDIWKSAQAILNYLDLHFDVHPFIKNEINQLIIRLKTSDV